MNYKQTKETQVSHFEDFSCNIRFTNNLCTYDSLPRKNYKLMQGCGSFLIRKQKKTGERHFTQRTNKPDKKCKAWYPSFDNAVSCEKNNWSTSCSTLRPFKSTASEIDLKIGSIQRFYMGFQIFAPKYTKTSWMGHNSKMIEIKVLDVTEPPVDLSKKKVDKSKVNYDRIKGLV